MKKVLVLFAVLWSVTTNAAFPDKPVKIITSMPVGSAPDSVIRKVADRLKDTWKVPVIIENLMGLSLDAKVESLSEALPFPLYFICYIFICPITTLDTTPTTIHISLS